MKKIKYEKSKMDKMIDKKKGYKENSKKDKEMDAMKMLKMGMQGRKIRSKKK